MTTWAPYPALFYKEKAYETMITDPYDLITPYFKWAASLVNKVFLMNMDYLYDFEQYRDDVEDYTMIEKYLFNLSTWFVGWSD